MGKLTAALAASIIAVLLSPPAEARHYHKATHHYRHYERVVHHYADRKHVKTGEHAFYVAPAAADTAETDQRYASRSNAVYAYAPVERASHHYTSSDEHVVGGRPTGCPHAFCGCEASLYVFGKIIPDLNLASNWIRKFPRTSPAPRMAAARNHHVMILISYVGGDDWLVHDGNSGYHLTREHVRSIAGYTIVDPNGAKMAMR